MSDENKGLNFAQGVIVTKDIENIIKETGSSRSVSLSDDTYKSPLQSLMGSNKNSDEDAPDGTPEYDPKLIESVVARIVKMSSMFKVDVFNLDVSEAREKYAKLHNKQNIKILSEEGSFCTYEIFNKDEKNKDTYYKAIVKYREIDYDRLIEGFEKACRSAILSYDIAIGAIFRMFSELEGRSDDIIPRLTKAGEEGIKQLKEIREKRKKDLGALAKKSREDQERKAKLKNEATELSSDKKIEGTSTHDNGGGKNGE